MGLFNCIPILVSWSLATTAVELDSQSSQATQSPCSITAEADGTYSYYAVQGGENAHCLDVYLPTAPALGQTLLFIHGGGFTFGDKAEATAIDYCQALADLGYHVVSANYTLAVEGLISPGTASFPQAVLDVKAAAAWIHRDPESLGLPGCIVAVGNSAGGALAALLGTTGGVAELEPSSAITYSDNNLVDGVVTFAAMTDFVESGCNGYQVVYPKSGLPVPCEPGILCGTDPSWVAPFEHCCFRPCDLVPCNDGNVGWCADYPGTTPPEIFVGWNWTISHTQSLCPSLPPTTSWTGMPFIDASAVYWADTTDPPYYGFSAELDPFVPGNQTGLLADALGGRSGHSLKAWREGCGHGIETLFDPVSCGSQGDCEPWEPLGSCPSCTNSAERAAFQTMSAIQLLQVTCE